MKMPRQSQFLLIDWKIRSKELARCIRLGIIPAPNLETHMLGNYIRYIAQVSWFLPTALDTKITITNQQDYQDNPTGGRRRNVLQTTTFSLDTSSWSSSIHFQILDLLVLLSCRLEHPARTAPRISPTRQVPKSPSCRSYHRQPFV